MKTRWKIILIGVVFLWISKAEAQNIEVISLKKGIQISGSLNFNSVGYLANGIDSRRDPLAWFASANWNIDAFGYNIPFSFSYSNTNRSFTQPFNQFSFAPQYKWVKTYIGYNAMTFSPYTLSGHVFLGGGLELSPGKWRVAAMYGRLRKEVPFQATDSVDNSQASFRRMGYGFKVGYEDEGDAYSLNVFHARDEPGSIPFVLPNSSLTPKQNLAVGLQYRKKFLKKLFSETELGYSIVTGNTLASRSSELDTLGSATNRYYFLKGIISDNPTTRHYIAYNTSLGYQGSIFGVQLKYERVAPEYQTLGAYFFNNDLENLTIAPNVKLWKGKISLGGNVGRQRNNLDKSRASSTERLVAAVNTNIMVTERWNLSANYSNFATFVRNRPDTDPFFRDNLDSLNFFQVNSTFSSSVSYTFGTKERSQNIMLNGSYQQTSDQSAAQSVADRLSSFYNGLVSYSCNITPRDLSISVSFNGFYNKIDSIENAFLGPNLGLNTAFLNRSLRASFSASYNQNFGKNQSGGQVLNNRLSFNYSPQGKQENTPAAGVAPPTTDSKKNKGRHILSLSLSMLQQFGQKSFNELTANFSYGYSF